VVWADTYLHTKRHLDPSSRLTTIDMDQKVGAAVSWLPVLIWTVKIWTVITNPNRNPNLNTNSKPNTNSNPMSNPNKTLTLTVALTWF